MDLTPIDLESLPALVFAYRDDDVSTFDEVTNELDLIRPAGGLWTSPAAPTGSVWNDFLATPDKATGLPSKYDGDYTKFAVVEVPSDARIYQIDTADDLDRLVERFPLPSGMPQHRVAPDWEAMAAAGWDALRIRGWDCGQRRPDTVRRPLARSLGLRLCAVVARDLPADNALRLAEQLHLDGMILPCSCRPRFRAG